LPLALSKLCNVPANNLAACPFWDLARIVQPGKEVCQANSVSSLRVNRTIAQPEVEKEIVT
jgi:hypothetical protein